MGRAQVFQAEAAKIEPIADMNPVLLKPSGNNKSQVIVRVKVVGEMPSSKYHDYKLELVDVLKETFNSLNSRYDIVVMEGAALYREPLRRGGADGPAGRTLVFEGRAAGRRAYCP